MSSILQSSWLQILLSVSIDTSLFLPKLASVFGVKRAAAAKSIRFMPLSSSGLIQENMQK